MAWQERLRKGLTGIGGSVARYPATALWLVLMTVVNAIQIENPDFEDYSRFLFTCLTGALLGAAAQQLYERFFVRQSQRWILLGGSMLLTIGYFFLLPADDPFGLIAMVKTLVLALALFIAFVWLPSIRNPQVSFHQSFLAAIKAGLVTVLFAGVLSAGVGAIFGATNQLLFQVDFRFFGHAANVIWSLFAPLYFLSLIPFYPGKGESLVPKEAWSKREEELRTHFVVPRFLEILLLYIIIPLTVVYTIILLLYIVQNIGSRFWTNNLLEPLLVSYAIVVIVVFLLACNLEHRIARLFRQIFPKILIPIVLLQTIASILRIGERGITYGRYYVILFGVFATAAAIIFSFRPVRQNGLIVPVLLVLSAVSLIPPIDAFTVSRNNQEAFLERLLERNGMLPDGEVVPNDAVSGADKVAITRSAEYLGRMEYTDDIAYLGPDFDVYSDFERTFGFPMTYDPEEQPFEEGRHAYLDWYTQRAVALQDADYLVLVSMQEDVSAADSRVAVENVQGELVYMVETERTNPYYTIRLLDADGQEVITIDTEELFQQAFAAAEGRGMLGAEEMSIVAENEVVRVRLLAQALDEFDGNVFGEGFLFIEEK